MEDCDDTAHHTCPYQLLFSYDESCFNNEDGIVDFMDNKESQCLASFFLDDAELHVMTPKGWRSYKFVQPGRFIPNWFGIAKDSTEFYPSKV